MWTGSVGRECEPEVWDGSVGRECELGVWAGILYLFRLIFAFWVEISGRWKLESLPFSAVFPCLGRDLHPAATGFSTLFGSFPLFG